MTRVLKVLCVLVLGARFEVPKPDHAPGWSINFDGPGMALVLYAVLTVITLTSILNHLPGVFALRRPLGVIRSGHEFLWAPAIFTVLAGVKYTGVIEGRVGSAGFWTLDYGACIDSPLPLAAFGVFAIMMWSLKLRASMIEANRRLS